MAIVINMSQLLRKGQQAAGIGLAAVAQGNVGDGILALLVALLFENGNDALDKVLAFIQLLVDIIIGRSFFFFIPLVWVDFQG